MDPLLELIVTIPTFGECLTRHELRKLREINIPLWKEVTCLIESIDQRETDIVQKRWEEMGGVLKPREGWDADPAASDEIIAIMKDFVFAEWPYSVEMRKDYVAVAEKLQELVEQKGSAIYGGSDGKAGGVNSPDDFLAQSPCQPSLQLYYTLNHIGETTAYHDNLEKPVPGVLDCFKMLFNSSVYTSCIQSDWCGWDEVEYLLLTTILSIQIPQPGDLSSIHSRFRYHAPCDLHPPFVNPQSTNAFTFMYDLLEHIVTSESSKAWHGINLIEALCYVSRSDELGGYGRRALPISREIVEIQRKTVALMCHHIDNDELSSLYEVTFKKGLKRLLSHGRNDLLTTIINCWVVRSQVDLPVTLFLGNNANRRLLLFSLLKWKGDELSSLFLELVRRKERFLIEHLWFHKKEQLQTAVDDDGNTALLLLCGVRGRTEKIVDYLLANGADIHATNNSGQTPLQRALSINNKKLVQVLTHHSKMLTSKAMN